MSNCKNTTLIIATLVLVGLAGSVQAERIKDITDIEGIRGNKIQGLGLIIGLDGTGDDSNLTRQMFANFLLRTEGLALDPDDLSSKAFAAVMVTATLGPFDREGSKIQVKVSSLGASSLQGGTLSRTELKGADGEVYANAGGTVTIGGFGASGDNSKITKNHITVGYADAIVEREELATYISREGRISLLLKNPDFTTAGNIADAINGLYPQSSLAIDPGTVSVSPPRSVTLAGLSSFIIQITDLTVKVDAPAVVVVNEKTGTVIIGQNVTISEVAIIHGSLSIIVEEKDFVSQPQPFSRAGTTGKTARTDITTVEEISQVKLLPKQASVEEIAKALERMGLSPRDIISIFEMLRSAGALQAELKKI